MKIIKSTLFFSGLIVSMYSYAASSGQQCEKNMASLEERFYAVLLSEKGDPINDSIDILKSANPCVVTKEHKALIEDLNGEMSHMAYTYTGRKDFFDYALGAYNKAISLDTARNEKVYWHLSRLMRSAGRYPEAIQYINKVLEMRPKPKEPLPYLETAFQLAVDTEQWDDAKGLMEELSRRDKRFYADPDLLLSSVEALCHFNQIEDAKKITQNVEDNVSLNELGKKILQKSKEKIRKCEKINRVITSARKPPFQNQTRTQAIDFSIFKVRQAAREHFAARFEAA